jgi:penicillin-binding protein 1A
MTQRTRRRQRRQGGIGAKLLIVFGAVVALLAIAAIAVTSWVLDVAADAPDLSSCQPIDRGGNTVVYAADGSKLGVVASPEVRSLTSIDRIPRSVRLATVAIEDQRFYQHDALDYEGIVRAALKNLEAGEAVEGGSTITQQLVRNLCIRNPRRTIERKIEEAQLAIEYSERHSRREILGSYLNVASYGTVEGTTAIGVGAASKIFFSKPVWELKLPEAALLAGLPQAPSEYNPLLDPGAAKARRDQVLQKMAKLGYVSPRRARAAMASGLRVDLDESYFEHREPYFSTPTG